MGTDPPLFSIVVPTYGRSEYLREAVESVLSQDVPDFEVIVVDDASPEPLRLPDEARLRVLHRTTNGGSSAARNTGIEEARGLYVTFLDDDDVLTPDRLTLALEGLERAPIATCWGGYLGAQAAGGRLLEGDVSDTILDGIAPHCGRTAVVRELCPFFDERFRGSEDVEWWIRLSRVGRVATIPKAGYRYRRHPGRRHGSGVETRINDRLEIMRLHHEYFDTHPGATAFAWKRIGLMAARGGDRRLARRALWRSLRHRPNAKTAWHLLRAARPSRASLGPSLPS